jgi:glycosyltransferase involved in cell wall biosynthesis
MNAKNKVSVIITTYGRDIKIVKEAVESADNQTFDNLEVLIIDDNGYGTEKQLDNQKFFSESGYRRVRYLVNKKNEGVQFSRNRGILESGGEFVAFLDDDDVWFKDKIEKQMKLMQDTKNCGMVFCDGYYMLNDGEVTTKKDHNPDAFKQEITHRMLLMNDYIGTTSQALIRKDALAKGGLFDINLPARQDYEMWLRISKNYTLAGVNEPLYYYRVHEGVQISKSSNKAYIGLSVILRKYADEYKGYPEAKARLLLKMAKRKKDMGEPLQTVGLVIKAVFTSPRYIYRRVAKREIY